MAEQKSPNWFGNPTQACHLNENQDKLATGQSGYDPQMKEDLLASHRSAVDVGLENVADNSESKYIHQPEGTRPEETRPVDTWPEETCPEDIRLPQPAETEECVRLDVNIPTWSSNLGMISRGVSALTGLDQYSSDVARNLLMVYTDNPQARGLLVVAGCKWALDQTGRHTCEAQGVENGIRRMHDTFDYLGYAVLNLGSDVSSLHLKNAVEVIARRDYPESYKRFFFYITSHGLENVICTCTGNVNIRDVISPLRSSQKLQSIPLIFIFDSCRFSIATPEMSQLTCGPNMMVIYPTLRGNIALADANMCGILTLCLTKSLKDSETSLQDTMTDVQKAMNDEFERRCLSTVDRPLTMSEITLEEKIYLLRERKEAMSPSLQVQSARDTSALIHVTPPHGGDQHKMKQLLVEYKEERAQSQRQQIQGESIMIQDLSPSTQYSVRAVAVYGGEEMRSEWTPFETQASAESPQRCLLCTRYTRLLSILICIIVGLTLIAAAIYTGVKGDKDPVTCLGYGGDTIVLAELNGLWQSKASVQECLEDGDAKHYPSIYLVERSNLSELHQRDVRYNTHGTITPSIDLLLPGNDVYLMWHSAISMDICLESSNASAPPTKYLVFKDHTLVYKGWLAVGSSEMSCTAVTDLSVKEPGYYSTFLQSHGQVTYNVTMHYVQTYINYTDFSKHQLKCSNISDLNGQCEVDLRLTDRKYVILAYIFRYQPYLPEPHTTHVCASFESSKFYFIFIGIIILYFIALLIVLFCCFCYIFCKHRHSRTYHMGGYERIH